MLKQENLKIAINYLNTLKEEDFIRNQQTLHFDPDNIGKKHCVYGWLTVPPEAPFHKLLFDFDNTQGVLSKQLFEDGSEDRYHFMFELADINNSAPEGKIKETVIKYLMSFIQ